MLAAVVTEIGGMPAADERPDPVAAAGEVVLEVLAAPLNPLDVAEALERRIVGRAVRRRP